MRDLLLALSLALAPPAHPTVPECRVAFAHPSIMPQALLDTCQWAAERCYVDGEGCPEQEGD